MAAHDDDLETQIRRAEQAVAERDRRVQRRSRELITRIDRGVRRSAGRGLWAALGALVLAKWLPSRPPATASLDGTASAAPGAVPWAALVPLLWPLLPPPWRRRLSPTTAAMIAGVALPVLRTLLPRRPPLRTVAGLDIARWAGRWHAIAYLPGSFGGRGARDASVTYRLRGDHLAIERCWRRGDGTVDCTPGVGYRTEGGGGAKLEVSFAPRALRWLPWAWSAQWVVDVDPEYRHAVVGTPDRKRLWLLAREPHVDDATYQHGVAVAAASGFRIEDLKRLEPGER